MLQPASPCVSLSAHTASTTGILPATAMLQPVTTESDDKPSDSAWCPTCLGNPASILPFLTAQASSVISMASGSQGSVLSSGGILTPSTHVLTGSSSGTDLKQSTSGLTAGLELGNGWKVVGLTSLADLPLPTSTSLQLSPGGPVNSACPELGTQDASNLNSAHSEAVSTNKSPSRSESGSDVASNLNSSFSEVAGMKKNGCILNTPPVLSSSVPGEWKVVGVTSLNPGNSDLLCNSKTAAVPAQSLTLPDSIPFGSGIDFSQDDSNAKQNEQSKESGETNNLGRNLFLPSVADVASGNCEWKIAGVTTLVAPVDASVGGGSNKAHRTPTDAARPVALPAITPENISLADAGEWKVVGVTSLNSTSLNCAPVVASSNTNSPLVMASAPSMVPITSPVTKDMVWKVVGMVPLQSQGEALPKETDSPALTKDQTYTCSISGSSAQSQSDSQESDAETPVPASAGGLVRDRVKKPWMSSRVTERRRWASRCLDRREDPSHPLGFLKNCSNQFRNAVLKRNTVSTMLELKRAYQDVGKKEKLLSFMEEMNHLSLSKNLMYFALKRLRSSKKAKPKSVDYDDLVEQNSNGLHVSSAHQNIGQDQDYLSSEDMDEDCVTENKAFCMNPPISTRQMSMNQSTLSVTDDKLALSMAYRTQMESRRNDILKQMETSLSSTTSHPHCPSQEMGGNAMPMEKYPAFSEISLKTIKTERQSELTIGDFDSDAVNLTVVDPWGVCTNEDLGDITEMMAEKGDNKVHQSSSRKRKLTTPRKMIQ
ncbi:uncharacterized protein LOC143282712 [Babylonia areolata]|uniref:uncharacterized protein LOC143282712 n=1 Tax=Babylonia areolata TaxID=304850 RepID=UPI003FD54C52